MHLWTPLDTPLGRLTLVGSARGLSQVYFPDEAPNLNGLQRLTDRSDSAWSSVKVLVAATQQITEYFAGTRRDFELLLDVPESPDTFRARAQRALRDIRFGERWTYSRLASAAGSAQAARAAGSACDDAASRASGSRQSAAVCVCVSHGAVWPALCTG